MIQNPLPTWVDKNYSDHTKIELLTKALEIAWGSLQRMTTPTGAYSQDHYEHAKNTIRDMSDDAKETLQRIAEVGGEK